MKLDRAALDKFLKAPGADRRLVAALVFGPDEGLVRERANQITAGIAGSIDDPFRIAELTADDLKDDPARLLDEIKAISMMGGRRVVRVTGASDGLCAPLEPLLDATQGARDDADAFLLLIGGDLGGKSALKRLCEAQSNAAAIACYADTGAELATLIRQQLKDAGVEADKGALGYLSTALIGDRGVVRAEIDKLILYLGTEKRLTLDMALAVIGDQAALALDDLVYAVADGDQAALERALEKTFGPGGGNAVSILRALARHYMRLHAVAGRLEAGDSIDTALAALRPPVFWNLKNRFQAQCRNTPQRLIARALARIAETESLAMRHYGLGEILTRRLAAELAAMASSGTRKRA